MKYFFCAASSCFFRHEIFSSVQHRLFFVDMKRFFVEHQLAFVNTRLFFVQHQTFYFDTNFFLRATPNFCFGHCLEYYAMVIYLYCHVATII